MNYDFRSEGKIILRQIIPKNVEEYEEIIFEFAKKKHSDFCSELESCYKDCIYELICSDCKDYEDIVKGKFLFNSKSFDDIRDKLEEQDKFTVCPFQVEEGIDECKKCGSKRTYSYQKQTRSADEPMTTFSQCTNCGKRWRYSG